MKNYVKMFLAGIFLATAFPFTMVLLLNGRQGIHKEKQLDPVDYQVLQQMLAEDLSWMSDDTLKLLAVLYRTEAFCVGESLAIEQLSLSELYGEPYGRIYQAIESTSGMAVTIDGEYRELPFHKLSVGHTRDGKLLGDSYDYVLSVECREDKEASDYVQICTLSMEEILRALGMDYTEMADKDIAGKDDADRQAKQQEIALDDFEFQRDSEGYVESVSLGDQTWTGEAFRSLLHFPSSCFWMKVDGTTKTDKAGAVGNTDNRITITIKGVGHGFGISLYTADRRIREGTPGRIFFLVFIKCTVYNHSLNW
ncbi:hypothetical protein DXA90_00170 [Clostridiaceae bacterium OF09-1]|nr:hypothetical protein DXA90_00170 [Clostridiaceae bacterium OF09-1]